MSGSSLAQAKLQEFARTQLLSENRLRKCKKHSHHPPVPSQEKELSPRLRGARRGRPGWLTPNTGTRSHVTPNGITPRLRGAPSYTVAALYELGIIPVLVGSTSQAPSCSAPARDHPRACGEHSSTLQSPWPWLGSSPRLRGAHRLPVVRGVRPGIIPALAGSTASRVSAASLARDHPRACGEHDDTNVQPFLRAGSSPRLRGGTKDFTDIWFVGEDHPRACGEHARSSWSTSGPAGSSPRLRGARARSIVIGCMDGIIPALAGSTSSYSLRDDESRDHPRACGEHIDCVVQDGKHLGSSPRLRGAHSISTTAFVRSGIIPALAGSTRTCGARLGATGDHPRACGEHVLG